MTLLQLACAFSVIATGYKVMPKLIMSSYASTSSARTEEDLSSLNNYENPKPVRPEPVEGSERQKIYSDASLNTIKEILEKTTLRGTARRAAIKGYRIMSKTGTANVLIDGKYDPDKNIYTCAGIVEKDDYQRVIVTFVKEAQQKNIYASTVAVPLFESVAEHMLIHDRIIS